MIARAWIFSLLLGAISLLVGPENASAEPGPQDERATTFVAGKADVSETFGESEGAALFGAGAVSIVSIFVILFIAGAVQRRNRERLERMDSDV